MFTRKSSKQIINTLILIENLIKLLLYQKNEVVDFNFIS